MIDAIQAEFTDYRPVKTRKVLQLVFEVPAEKQAEVFRVLGYPVMGQSIWVGVARLAARVPAKPEPVAEPEKTKTLRSNKAAVMVKENQDFKNWLVDTYWTGKEEIGDYDGLLKRALGIQSKKELDVDGPAADRWEQMLTSFTYRAQVRA